MYHSITQTFNVGAGEINMNIVKSASKLSGAFITLYRTPKQGIEFGKYLPDNYVYKRWNYFYNPMINGRINDVGTAPTADASTRTRFCRPYYDNYLGRCKFNQLNIQSLKHKV